MFKDLDFKNYASSTEICTVTVRTIMHKSVYKQSKAPLKKIIIKNLVCLLHPKVVSISEKH